MASYVTPKLPNRVIPLTKDCDRSVALRRKDDLGDPVAWGADVYILIDIDRANPTKVDASVVGAVATIKIEAATANLCRSGTTWRVVMSQAGSPTNEVPLMVGTFERNDGK